MSVTEALEPGLAAKLDRLEAILHELGAVCVAYSGGVDSAYLLAQAQETLDREHVIGIIGVSASLPPGELDGALSMAEERGIRVETVDTAEQENPDYLKNDPDRCYHCKAELFDVLGLVAKERELGTVCDGFNRDDEGDHRPGHQAGIDRTVRSPLQEAGLTKAEIRVLSKRLALPTWNKPALACLASRIPYGTPVTLQALDQVGQAELYLKTKGLRIVRVRHHADVARIEVAPEERAKFFDPAFMDDVAARFKALGFQYVALDLQGYRSGSLNEGLPPA